jgi:hypothetical protein
MATRRLRRLAAIVLLVALIGIAVFLATFDADRYRPLLASKLQEALGQPVMLERLSLSWRGGIAVRLHGVSVGESLVQVESAHAVIRLWPLLRRELQVESLHLEGGTVRWADATRAPPAEVQVRQIDLVARHIVPGRPMDLDVRAALGAERQNVRLRGRLTLPTAGLAGSLEAATLTIDNLALQEALPAAQPGTPQLQGTLSLAIEGRAPTLDPKTLRETITASGRLTLDPARIANLNVLRVVFEKLSMIPGVLQALETRLPESYQAKLAAPDTVFEPVELPLRLEAGGLQLDDLRVRSDTFEVAGTGRIDLSGRMNLRAVLRVEPQLTAAIIKSVNELRALADADGQLAIPVTVQGQAPQVAVLPDVEYLASRLIATTVQSLIGTLLEKTRDAP